MFHSTLAPDAVSYHPDPGPGAAGGPLGGSGRAGLAGFLGFAQRAGVERARAGAGRRPVRARTPGFTAVQKSLAVRAAPASGGRSARAGDFTLAAEPAAGRVLRLPRWPHSSRLTRHRRAVRPRHVRARRGAVDDPGASHAAARRRLRRGERVVIDRDQTASGANGRTHARAAKGHSKQEGARGYQATAAFAGDPGGGDDAVLAACLDPGNAPASRRFADRLDGPERVLGPRERLPGLVLRFACQDATPDDRAVLLERGLRFGGRVEAAGTAATWARERVGARAWTELSPVEGVAELGDGPVSGNRPDVAGRRVPVRSTGARHRTGSTAILTNPPPAELPAAELAPFSEARQTIEGWRSEATAARQLTGLWARAFAGLEASRLHAAPASNLLNGWERRQRLPASGLPHLGLRQLIGRVVSLPARILRTAGGRLALLLPPAHPYARRLAPAGPGWQLPLPFPDLDPCDAHS